MFLLAHVSFNTASLSLCPACSLSPLHPSYRREQPCQLVSELLPLLLLLPFSNNNNHYRHREWLLSHSLSLSGCWSLVFFELLTLKIPKIIILTLYFGWVLSLYFSLGENKTSHYMHTRTSISIFNEANSRHNMFVVNVFCSMFK